MAEWLCSGLQSRVRRFDSGFSLQIMKRALFLDRDGVINVDYGYVHKIKDLEIYKDVINLIRQAKIKNYLVIIVTNQSGIGRGFFSKKQFHDFMSYLIGLLEDDGAIVDDYFFCSCNPENSNLKCQNRKPLPGLFHQAKAKYSINLEESVMVGDKITDAEAANNANLDNIYIINRSSDFLTSKIDFNIISSLDEIKL